MNKTYSAISHVVTGKTITAALMSEIHNEYPRHVIEDIDFNTGESLNTSEAENLLKEICDHVHSHCDIYCPVFEMNNGEVPLNKNKSNCKCFKNGSKMLKFISHRMVN